MKRVLLLPAALLGGAWAGAALLGEGSRPPALRPGAAAAAQDAVAAAPVAYHAAWLYADPGRAPLQDAWLVVGGGKVVAAVDDPAELPPLLEVVELGESVLIPGLVAADAAATGSGWQGDQALGAHLRALDSFDPWEDLSAVLRRGVTTYYLSPDRDRLIGGRGAVVKSAGATRVLREFADLRANVTPEVFQTPPFFRPPIPPTAENPLRPGQPQPPTSLAGALMVLRELPELARGGAGEAAQDFLDFAAAARQPLRVAADREEEVRGALGVAASWGKTLLIEGGREAGRLARELRAAAAGVVFEMPLFLSATEPGADWRPPEPDALTALAELGPRLALSAGSQGRWTWLLEAASAAVGYGLDQSLALAAVTSNAAGLLGVGERVGTLLPGYDADFVVLSGAPLAAGSAVQQVYVDGALVWNEEEVEEQEPAGVVLRAGTVWTGDGPPLSGGAEVLLRDGRVAAVGRSVARPPGARVIDAGPDAHLTPGFIDARSFLGLESMRPPDSKALLGLLGASSRFRKDWAQVAGSGVTTVVVAPRRAARNGTRTQAVKTSATTPDQAYLAGHDLVFYDLTGGDHANLEAELKGELERGKQYFEKWEKYREERRNWEAEQAKKGAEERDRTEAELRKRLAQGKAEEQQEEKKEEEQKPAEEAKDKPEERDPINGLWEGTVESEFLPEPVNVHARLHHEGAKVTAVLSSPDFPGDDFELQDGTWDGRSVRFEVAIDFGTIVVVGEVDAPDHMAVNVSLAGFGAVDFELTRSEYEEGGAPLAGAARRRSKADEGPEPPKLDANLEAERALFEKRGVALAIAGRADEIRVAVEVFTSFQLPVQVVDGAEADQVAELLRQRQVGVVVPAELVQREENRDLVPAVRLHGLGVATAFQSQAAQGARFLPAALAMATRFGLDPEQALAGVTWRAALLLGIDQRVGRLAPGLDGDVVVHSGPPFDLRSRVVKVFVNGQEVPEVEEE